MAWASIAQAGDEVMELPDGHWVAPPVLVATEADPVGQMGWERPFRHRLVIGEDKTLLRKLYEALPPALRAKVKAAPAAPKSQTASVQHDQVLVFPMSLTAKEAEQYFFAFIDDHGEAGRAGHDDTWRLNEYLVMAPVVPRKGERVRLAAWKLPKGESAWSYSPEGPPLAQMQFPNPLYTSSTLWPDGQVEAVQEWRGRTLTLAQATRTTEESEMEFEVEGLRTAADFKVEASYFEDNRGNRCLLNMGWGTSGDSKKSFRNGLGILWSENRNWKGTLHVRPTTRLAMLPEEFRTFRLELPEGSGDIAVVDAPFELNGVEVKSIRLVRSQKHRMIRPLDPVVEPLYDLGCLEIECGPVPPDLWFEVTELARISHTPLS